MLEYQVVPNLVRAGVMISVSVEVGDGGPKDGEVCRAQGSVCLVLLQQRKDEGFIQLCRAALTLESSLEHWRKLKDVIPGAGEAHVPAGLLSERFLQKARQVLAPVVNGSVICF